MDEIYVLDKNLKAIDVIDSYKSCIWANRYNDIGDCELYVEASSKNLKLLKMGNYLIRLDDEMVCEIKKIELDTNTEDGDYLIVTGVDTKDKLNQRIIWGTMNCDGNIEDFIRLMITNNIINPSIQARKFLKTNGGQLLYLADKFNLSEVTTEQISYQQLGEKIKEYCKTYDWGFKIFLDNQCLYFKLYKGTDRSDYVVFSNDYENLHSSKFLEDNTNKGNVGLIAGEGEGSERVKETIGNASSTDRYEVYIDARDISKTITFGELKSIYPNGIIVQNGEDYAYKMNILNIQIVSNEQLEILENKYPNGILISIDGNDFYQLSNIIIANMITNELEDEDDVELRDVIYSLYLLNKGQEQLAEYGSSTSFEGSVEPNTTFEYKKDYYLGDLVSVENEYGISMKARIVEVIEVNDENGYSIEPKFEYIPKEDVKFAGYLMTENNEYILTEDEEIIEIE